MKSLPMIASFILFFSSPSVLAASMIMGQLKTGYDIPRTFQNSQTSSYTGFNSGAKVIYRLSAEGFSLAPVFSYQQGKYKNAANNSLQTETITDKAIGAGLRVYWGPLFTQINYSWLTLTDTARGQVHLNIYDRANGLSAALGGEVGVSRYIKIELAGDIASYKFQTKSGGFSSPTQYIRYGAQIGISFVLPSEAPKESLYRLSSP